MVVGGPDAFLFDGSTWGAPASLGWAFHVTGISCPSSSFCMAVDNGGNYSTYSTSGGWTTPAQLLASSRLSGVSCASATFCAALGSGNGTLYTWTGGTWTASSVTLGPQFQYQGTVSCAPGSADFCVAVSGANAAVYSGGSWSTTPIDTTNGDLTGVSCPTTSSCVAVDANGEALTYSGSQGWSGLTPIDSNASSFGGLPEYVSCLAAGTCVVSGSDGYAEILQNGTWSAPTLLGGGGPLGNVSCNSSYCVIASFASVYYVQQLGGSYGYGFNTSPETAGSANNFNDFWASNSCWSSGCMLVSSINTAEEGA